VPEPLNTRDFERLAEGKVGAGPWGYFLGGAGDERTLAENLAAFRRWHLRPRMLVDVASVTTTTTILGSEISMPILVAPTAFQYLAHPDGDLAMARGAAKAGTVMCLSTLGGASPAQLADTAPGGRHWFQLYWSRDRGFTQALVEAAATAGFEAIVLTVDLPAAGRRERDIRAAFEIPTGLPLPNLSDHLGGGDFHATLSEVVDPSVTWRDLEWLRSVSPLPLLLKGILTEEDARLACEHGVEGVVVSNHGGRQLDGA
jgi:4-hydroxymandelate oxidase